MLVIKCIFWDKTVIIILIVLIIKSEKNRKKAEELSFSLIEVLEMANQLNDEDTGDHVKRLGMYSTLLSEKVNLPKETRESIKRFSSLHDIGKVAIPSEILKKPSQQKAQPNPHSTSTPETHPTLESSPNHRAAHWTSSLNFTQCIKHVSKP